MNSDELNSTYCRASEIPNLLPNLFTERQWEWVMRNRASNGVSKAVRKLGGRLFIHIPDLYTVLEQEGSN